MRSVVGSYAWRGTLGDGVLAGQKRRLAGRRTPRFCAGLKRRSARLHYTQGRNQFGVREETCLARRLD